MNPAPKGTDLYATIARRQVLEKLGRVLVGDPHHEFTPADYEAIDDAEEKLDEVTPPTSGALREATA